MMRDVNSHHSDDPAHRWSALLSGLIGRRRDAVVKALRNSVDSGYPANADGVRVLVAYAQGQISARQYVAQVLESLGFVPAAYVPAPAVRAPESWHSARDADPWRAPGRVQDPWRDELSAPTPTALRMMADFWTLVSHGSSRGGIRNANESTTVTRPGRDQPGAGRAGLHDGSDPDGRVLPPRRVDLYSCTGGVLRFAGRVARRVVSVAGRMRAFLIGFRRSGGAWWRGAGWNNSNESGGPAAFQQGPDR